MFICSFANSQTPLHMLIPKKASTVIKNDTVQFNLYDSAGGNIGKLSTTGWYDWSPPQATTNFSDYLTWTAGSNAGAVNSGIRLQFGYVSNNSQYIDNGSGYASSQTTNFPTGVFRVALFNTNNNDTLKFSGVPSGTYKIEIICSRSTATTRPVTFNVGGNPTQTLNANNNTSIVVVLDNVSPSSGLIKVNISQTSGFWYVNGGRLIRKN